MTTTSHGRTTQYIPPNTGSMTMTLLSVDGNPPPAGTTGVQGPFNLTLGTPSNPNTNCVAAQNGTVCTIQISAPIGKDIFVANTFSSSDGKTGPLGSGAIVMTIALNTTNAASLTLYGPVASVILASSSATLNNGNPTPAPGGSGCNCGAVIRVPAAVASARAAAAVREAQSAVRRPAGAVTPSPSPAPVVTTSRIFVIAVDAVGNQIINPTTFDIPINIVLGLNGMPPNVAALNVHYAGLPGPDSAPDASTAADGGSVTAWAPADIVTLSLQANSFATPPSSPSLVASYTPQGGTLQTSPVLAFTVTAAPPASQFTLVASHAPEPFPAGLPETFTVVVGNSGTLATSGTVTVDSYLGSYLSYNNDAAGTGWTCQFLYGYDVECTTANAIAPHSTAPAITFTATGTTATTTYNDAYVNGGAAVNTGLESFDYPVTINSAIADLQISGSSPTGSFTVNAAGSVVLNVTNDGGAPTTSLITVTESLPANFTYNSGTGAGWTCSLSANITCTNPGPLAASTTSPITLNLTPLAAALAAAQPIAFQAQVTTGAPNVTSSSPPIANFGIPVYGVFTDGSVALYQFTQACGTVACSMPSNVSETNYTNWIYTSDPTTPGCVNTVVAFDVSNNIIPLHGGTCKFTIADDHGGTTGTITATVTTIGINPTSRRKGAQ